MNELISFPKMDLNQQEKAGLTPLAIAVITYNLENIKKISKLVNSGKVKLDYDLKTKLGVTQREIIMCYEWEDAFTGCCPSAKGTASFDKAYQKLFNAV